MITHLNEMKSIINLQRIILHIASTASIVTGIIYMDTPLLLAGGCFLGSLGFLASRAICMGWNATIDTLITK